MVQNILESLQPASAGPSMTDNIPPTWTAAMRIPPSFARLGQSPQSADIHLPENAPQLPKGRGQPAPVEMSIENNNEAVLDMDEEGLGHMETTCIDYSPHKMDT